MRRLIAGWAAVLLLSLVAGNAWGDVQYAIADLGTMNTAPGPKGASANVHLNNHGQVAANARGTMPGMTHAILYTGGILQDIGSLGGGSSYVCGINESGQVVGYSATSTDNIQAVDAFLYSGGTMQDLGANGCAYAINNNGQVAGALGGGQKGGRAFLWQSGSATQDLGTLGGANSIPNAINDSGQVAGVSETSSGDTHAFLYSGGLMQDLGTLGGSEIRVYGMNKHGQIVGHSSVTPDDDEMHAFLYSDGAMQDLGAAGRQSCAYAVNDSGQVVGDSNRGSGDDHAFLYTSGAMQDLGAGTAWAINNRGQVVGQDGDGHAFRYSGGLVQDLNRLIDPASGWLLESAVAINDNGQIVGWGVNPSGDQQGFLLTPTPEPSTLVLLVAGAASLLSYAWRRRRQAM